MSTGRRNKFFRSIASKMQRPQRGDTLLAIPEGDEDEDVDPYLEEAATPRSMRGGRRHVRRFSSVDTRRKWRQLPLCSREKLLPAYEDRGPDEVMCIFPGGIQVRLASNPNTFHVELRFSVPFCTNCPEVSVVIPPRDSAMDVWIVNPPTPGGPRSEAWCQQYGIITPKNLRGGVVEERGDGTLVVYRTFRHSPSMVTPFGAWKGRKSGTAARKSETDLMIYTVVSFFIVFLNRVRMLAFFFFA